MRSSHTRARISQATHANDLLQNRDNSDSDVTGFKDTHRPLVRIEITILHALYNRLDLGPIHLQL